MCTAITYKTFDHYFGRNLDLEFSYGEKVIITPRNFIFKFRHVAEIQKHFALIGIGIDEDCFPLYFDATNEFGLSVAALNFPDFAHYFDLSDTKTNISSFEIIPWVLCQCKDIYEVKQLLSDANIVNTHFSSSYLPSPLHWMISDKNWSVTLESTSKGLKLYDNPVGVLTNNPPFEMQIFNLNNFMNLSADLAENRFSEKVELKAYSQGMGAMGLPGDLSSSSRFVRASFTKLNSISGNSESESISQFFHILDAVAQQRGCARLEDGQYEFTVYSSCCNTDKGIYYYTTYENSQINAVYLDNENLDAVKLISYPLIRNQQINKINHNHQ